MVDPKLRFRKRKPTREILAVLNRTAPLIERTAAKNGSAVGEPLKPLGITAGLEPYTAALDRHRAAHLLRRVSFGADVDELDALIGRAADEVVDELVDAAIARPLPEEPSWAKTKPPGPNASEAQFDAFFEQNEEWIFYELLPSLFEELHQGGLREKLALFWHGHFVTGLDSYFMAAFGYQYVTMLRRNALGNFKTFVHDVGLDASMLYYLNGDQNQVGQPNENYARELCELFTMGITDDRGNDNYTEEDIEEIARALTGWVVDWFNLKVEYLFPYHDHGNKTFFGRTGAFGYDDVIDIIFEERAEQIARFICRKIYREFVYAAPDETIVAELTEIFQNNNFEIAPVVRTLLKSTHFFDTQTVGARIKSPIEEMLGFTREAGTEADDDFYLVLFFLAAELGQFYLEPPNVAGWPGHRTWLNTSTLVNRWDFVLYLVYGNPDPEDEDDVAFPGPDLRALAEKLHDPDDALAPFRLPVALAQHLMPIRLEELNIDPVGGGFGGDLVTNPIPAEIMNGPVYELELAKRFLVGIPWYEWDLNHPDAEDVIRFFLFYITQVPEFQLA